MMKDTGRTKGQAVVGRWKKDERKRAEEALRKSETRYRTLIETILEGVCITDEEEAITFANRAFADMLGYKPEELVGQNLRKLVSEEDWLKICSEAEKRRRGESSWYEVTLLGKKGAARSVIVSAAPFLGLDGRFLGSLGVITDIIERKQTEKELRNERDKAQNYLDIAGVIIVAIDSVGKVTLINRKGCQILGYREEEIVGKNWVDNFVPNRIRSELLTIPKKLLSGEIEPAEFYENPVLTRSGEERLIAWHNTVLRDEAGNIAGTLSSGEDITERRRTEEELSIAEGNFRNSIENSPLGICIVTAEGEVLYANKAMLEIPGYKSFEELKATPISKLYTPESYVEHLERREKRKLGKAGPSSYEVSIVRNDGQIRHLVASRKPVVWSGEIQFQVIYQDVTERKQGEEALQESEERFHNLVESVPIGIVITSPDGHIIEANKAVAQMHRFDSKEEYMKMPTTTRYLDPADRERFMSLATKGLVKDFEVRRKRNDGTIFWASLSAIPQTTKSGEQVLITAVQDITERKQAEEELRESEARYRALIDLGGQVGEAVVMLQDEEQRDGVQIFCSDTWFQITGYSREELGNMTFGEIVHPKDREASRERHRRKISGESIPGLFEMTLIRKDGMEVPIELTSAYSTYQGKRVNVVYVRDITQRKQAQEALRQSEEKLRLMFEALPDGITVVDIEGKIMQTNKSTARMYGYDNKEELIGLRIFEFIVKQEHTRITEIMEKSLKEGYLGAIEVTQVRKDGSEFLAEISGAILKDASGHPIGYVTIMKDITERRKAEEALLQSEKNYRELAESIKDIFFAMNNELRYVYWNRACERLTGIAAKDALGKHLYDIFPDVEETKRAEKEYLKAIKTKQPQHFVNEYHLGGEDFVFDISAYPSQAGVSVFVKDITERKRAEEMLLQNERKYRTLIENLPQKIFLKDRNLVYVSCNENYARDLKIKPIKIAGKTDYEFYPRELAEKYRADGRKVMESGQQEEVDEHYIQDGQERTVHTVKIPVRDEKGEVSGVLGIFWDVTKQRQTQEQLIVTDRLASVGQLASGIAHELNNPLTGVIGFSDLLLERDLPADIKEDLETINREAKRTANVVKGLLTFARRQGTEKTLVDINSIIQGVLQLRSYEHKVSNIEINDRFISDLPQVMGNGGQLQQVFINIIINAEQAMLEARGRGALTITTERVGDIVRASIADDGPGISPGNMRKLFTPFFTTKEVGKGTGLGLSICHGIVTEHGGKIYAESELGKGATFIVELPIATSNDREGGVQ